MTRTLGAGITTAIPLAAGERCQLLYFDFADSDNNSTPVYVTTAAQDISWDSHTWEAMGGLLDLDALGESADDPSQGQRIKLAGVDLTFMALALAARCRGRTATIYHAAIDNAGGGTILADPVLMFSGPMNGGFQASERRGQFGGGSAELTCRLTSRLAELSKTRGVRTNVASHRAAISGASADTGFQNVAGLVNRKIPWGVKTPNLTPMPGPQPGGGPGGQPSGGTPWTPPPNSGNPSVPNAPVGTPSPPPAPGKTGIWNI